MEMRAQLIKHNRPGTRISPTSVTIHNTGNPNSTAQNNRDYFSNHPDAKVSSHWVVDDKEAIQCIPENEMSWHAGPEANRQSISIEVCEFTDPVRHEKAYLNAVKLSAEILRRYGWGVDRLTTHQRWTGKYCPWHILPIWDKFVADVQAELTPPKKRLPPKPKKIEPTLVHDEESGTTLPAYVIDGTTYAPVRAIAEAVGRTVVWDAKTNETTIKKAMK